MTQVNWWGCLIYVLWDNMVYKLLHSTYLIRNYLVGSSMAYIFGTSSSVSKKMYQNKLRKDLELLAGYSAIRNMGNYGMGNGVNGDVSPASNGLKGHNFSSRPPSSLGLLPQISEIGSESPDDTKIAMSNSENHFFASGFSFNSWNNSPNVLENFSGFKRGQDNTLKVFHGGQVLSDDEN